MGFPLNSPGEGATGDPAAPGGGAPGPSALLGEDSDPSMGQTPGMMPGEDANTGAVMLVREMQQQVDSLAQQYPAAANEARAASDCLSQLLQVIVSAPGEDPEAPEYIG